MMAFNCQEKLGQSRLFNSSKACSIYPLPTWIPLLSIRRAISLSYLRTGDHQYTKSNQVKNLVHDSGAWKLKRCTISRPARSYWWVPWQAWHDVLISSNLLSDLTPRLKLLRRHKQTQSSSRVSTYPEGPEQARSRFLEPPRKLRLRS
jgi:hypothetical protein